MWRWWLAVVVIGIIGLTGCTRSTLDFKTAFMVDPGKVEEVKKLPQAKVDVYVPLMEQFDSSKHAEALSTLNSISQRQDYCYNCHSAEYRLAPENAKPDVKLVSTSITCIVCHNLTNSGFSLKTTPLETCTQCHTAVKITPGQEVKHPQKEMFTGTGALEVADRPSTKYNAGLTCIECHMPNQSHTFEALTPAEALQKKVGDACMMCHTKLSPEQFASKVTELQQRIEEQTSSEKKQLDELKSRIEQAKQAGKNMDKVQPLYDVALTNVSFVEADGSKGVHNFEYASDILKEAQSKINAAKELLGK